LSGGRGRFPTQFLKGGFLIEEGGELSIGPKRKEMKHIVKRGTFSVPRKESKVRVGMVKGSNLTGGGETPRHSLPVHNGRGQVTEASMGREEE